MKMAVRYCGLGMNEDSCMREGLQDLNTSQSMFTLLLIHCYLDD